MENFYLTLVKYRPSLHRAIEIGCGTGELLRHPNSICSISRRIAPASSFGKHAMHRWLRARGHKTKFTLVGFQNPHLFYSNKRVMTRLLAGADFDTVSFSTIDPYNRQRMSRALKSGRLVEAGIAFARHALSLVDLAPECLIVARARTR